MIAILPFPPLLNRYYTYWRGGRQLTNEGRAYKTSTLVRAKTQGMTPLEGDVCLQLTFYRKARRGDIDAPLKCLLDSLQGVAYKSDSQVKALYCLQLDDPADPRVRVSVTPWSQADKAASVLDTKTA